MIELYGLFDCGEIINLKFSKEFLDSLDDSEVFEIFEIEYRKRYGIKSACMYLGGSPDFDLG